MNPRRIGAVLAIVASILVLAGTFSSRWLTAPGDVDGGVGLTGMEVCGPRYGHTTYGGYSNCITRDWDQIVGEARGDKDLKLLATAAMVAVIGSIAAASLLGFVGVAALVTTRTLSIASILAAIGAVLALLGAIATAVILLRYFRHERFALGYSIYLYGAGCVAGVVGSILARGRA